MANLLYYAQLTLEALAGVFGVRMYEEPRYSVLATLPAGVEIRRYEPRLAAEVSAAGADAAFRTLFAYISAREKIAMTMPVATRPADGTVRMQFFLPAKYGRGDVPRPADPRVRILELPAEELATLRFSGAPTEIELARRGQALSAALEGSGWRADSAPVALFYDAPFTLPFLRRTEVAVRVAPS
jgi:hypothetical protein